MQTDSLLDKIAGVKHSILIIPTGHACDGNDFMNDRQTDSRATAAIAPT